MRRHLVARPRVWLAVGAVLAVAAAELGCASTRITSTWRDPGVGAVRFRKVVGVALARDATLRRLAEDEFVRALGPAAALAGYAVIPDEEVRDRDKAKARVEAAGADGVVVFRLVGVETEQRWVPPTSYGHAWGSADREPPRRTWLAYSSRSIARAAASSLRLAASSFG